MNNLKQAIELNEQTGAEIKEGNTVIERTRIEGTPFVIVKKEETYFLVFGKYKLTEEYETMTEVLDYMIKHQWDLMAALIATMIEIHENNEYQDLGNGLTD